MRRLFHISFVAFLVILSNANNKANSEVLNRVYGELTYPSDYIPELLVCAHKIENNYRRYCINHPGGSNKFNMSLPTGRYYFSSQLKGYNMTAWLTNYNAGCGFNCDTGEIRAIAVYVRGGQSQTIPPIQDWYTGFKNIVFPY